VEFSKKNALAAVLCLAAGACALVEVPYDVTKTAVKGTVWTVKTSCKVVAGTTVTVYKVGKFTFNVVSAPLSWPLAHGEIESIGGLPPEEAIRLGKVKTSPYVVGGQTYYPISVKEASKYDQTGLASWYGYETLKQNRGAMTADGEVFDPKEFTAAHKYLPLPCFAKVTNLENGRSIIVRVNDRADLSPARKTRGQANG
jgi:rare lipoprotein A